MEGIADILHYSPNTGIFTWLISASSRAIKGQRAGCKNSRGYRAIRYKGKQYRENRLAFLYMTGAWPKGVVDHYNHVCDDNRWVNLRDCTPSQNRGNTLVFKNKSGYKGVYAERGKWKASIGFKGKTKYIGRFDCIHVAAKAYNKMALNLFGEFAYINIIRKDSNVY